MTKKLFITAFLSFGILGFAQDYTLPAISPRQKVEQQLSISKISVDYGRPGVKGRKIFGELVPFGKVWRVGANASTKISFGQDFMFGGKEIKAGEYGLFVIPQANEWRVILNKDAEGWGAYNYNEKLNVLEVPVPVKQLKEKQEWLTIYFDDLSEENINMVIAWDTSKVEVPIKVSHPERITKIIENLKAIKDVEKEINKQK